MQYCDGYTYCSADQLRPRNVCSSNTHETLGDFLCAHFPLSPFFFDFRDPRNYLHLYNNPNYTFNNRHRGVFNIPFGEEFSAICRMDDRIQSRLALAADCMELPDNSLLAKQRLREYVLQMAPAMISTIRGDPMFIPPHRNVKYTTDILPKMPITLANELMCRLDKDLHNIPLSDAVEALLWGLMEKTTPRMCLRRCSNKQLSANYSIRPVFHLTLEVTMLYGFLGCDPNAVAPPSLITSMAIIVFFRHLYHATAAQYASFIEAFEFVIFLSWILYTFEHIDQQEGLKRTFLLFPTRVRYVAAIRESIKCVHALLERHLRPIAMDMILNRKKETHAAVWASLLEDLRVMHQEYKEHVGTAVIMRTMEPTFECMSIKWMTQMRSAIRDEKIPFEALPCSVRNEMGNHALLSQEELRAIELLATYNVAIAAQPIAPLLLLVGISEEALRIFSECIIKFTCRLGAKHAILKDAAECIQKCDLRSVMIIQQFLEFCSISAGIYLAPLSAHVKENQLAALRRRFQMPISKNPLLGRFYYCAGCRIKLTQTVRHPNVKSLLCSSMHDLSTLAYYTKYVSYKVPPKGGGRRTRSATNVSAPEKNIVKSIALRTRRTGCTSGALLSAENGEMMCIGCRSDDATLPSWCSSKPICIHLPGNILYDNQKAYTICVQCGSFCSYVQSAWTPNGPICSVHPPELATVLHAHAAGQFDVLNPSLNAFLNRASPATNNAPPWMCEITKCRCKCSGSTEVIILNPDNTLRLGRLCIDHEETLRVLLGGDKRGAHSMWFHTAEQINEMILHYCTSENKYVKFLHWDGIDQYFGPKVK